MAGVAISGLAGVPRAVKYTKLSAFSQLFSQVSGLFLEFLATGCSVVSSLGQVKAFR